MEHIYFEAQLCSQIATLKEKPKTIKTSAKNRLTGVAILEPLLAFSSDSHSENKPLCRLSERERLAVLTMVSMVRTKLLYNMGLKK